MGRGIVAIVRVGLEAKAAMTEHVKAKPRLYDELNSSHQITHRAHPRAIAAGLVIVNTAPRFISPTNPGVVNTHASSAAADLIAHLGTVPVRSGETGTGFEALTVIAVDADNQGHASLHTAAPAPALGSPLHYATFIRRICDFYTQRFIRA